MGNITSVVVTLKEFFLNEETLVEIKYRDKDSDRIEFLKGRRYIVPDYQREIRWNSVNVHTLVKDVLERPKFLGNIILSQKYNSFEIIDGQQRISILTFILRTIMLKCSISETLCGFAVESFNNLDELVAVSFDYSSLDEQTQKEVDESDYLTQKSRYTELWKYINNNYLLSSAEKYQLLYDNLMRCEFNVILNNNYVPMYTIGYFLDVNVKSVKLDNEDILKGLLFSQDDNSRIRKHWVMVKRRSNEMNEILKTKMIEYPFMKIVEHYLNSNFYTTHWNTQIIFDSNFLITKNVNINNTNFLKGDHLVDVLKNKIYFNDMFFDISQSLIIYNELVNNSKISHKMRKLFIPVDKQVNDVEKNIIFCLMRYIIMDSNLVPKLVLMKYTLSSFRNKDSKIEEYRMIYGVMAVSLLFSIFEKRKGSKQFIPIAKSKDWYPKVLSQISTYISKNINSKQNLEKISKSLLKSNRENQQFISRSVATVFNYMYFQDGNLKVRRNKEEMQSFLTESSQFNLEHLIIPHSLCWSYTLNSGNYTFDLKDYPRARVFCNSIFNFVYISRTQNEQIENRYIYDKITQLEGMNDICAYSKMIVSCLVQLKNMLPVIEVNDTKESFETKLASFLNDNFDDFCLRLSTNILEKFLKRISRQ